MPRFNAMSLLSSIALVFAGHGIAMGGDPQRGQMLFKSCSACHNSDANATGPSLTGILGRKAASIANFHYSATLSHSGIVWTAEALRKFVADPQGFVPGNRMAFAGIAAANDVDDIVAFLETLR
jgi:cytochrome c2